MRALPWRTVLERELVIPYGGDAFYHLRRTAFSAARFPASLDFDPYIHFPAGARPIWTPVFDWVLALLLRPWAGSEPGPSLERAAMWVPPLLGALTVGVVYRLARRNFGPVHAPLAAGTLAVLSGHFWYSQIGFLDHHAAVALCAAWLLACGLAWVSRPPRRASAAALGLAVGLSLLVWPGALLHAGLVLAGCWLEALVRADRREARIRAGQLALAAAVACAAVLPLAAGTRWPQWGRMSPVVLGGFQPWALASLALLGLGCRIAWGRAFAGASRPRRAASACGLGLALLALGLLAAPGLAEGAGDAWRWLARREAFQAQVGESQPLFASPDGTSAEVAAVRLSLFAFALPAVWVLAVRAARRPEAAALRLLVVWSLGLGAATLAQRRFFDSFAIAVALLLAWTFVEAWRRLPAGWRRRRRAAVAGFAGLWAALLAPSLASYRPHWENERRAALGLPLEVSARRFDDRVLLETALWMRSGTPPTSGWLEAGARPEYGVIGPWEAGHAIEYAARRPAVVDGFGDDLGPENMERAERYFRAAEPEALEIAASLRARYALVAADFGWTGPRPGPGSLFRSLHVRDGSAAGRWPAAGGHRLVYESGPPAAGARRALYKVFEIVAGARIEGRAAPGARVALELPLRTNRGRAFAYRAAAEADAAGRYAFRVPYASGGAAGAVEAGGAYRLACQGERADVAVSEASVREGRAVAGPDLCGATRPTE